MHHQRLFRMLTLADHELEDPLRALAVARHDHGVHGGVVARAELGPGLRERLPRRVQHCRVRTKVDGQRWVWTLRLRLGHPLKIVCARGLIISQSSLRCGVVARAELGPGLRERLPRRVQHCRVQTGVAICHLNNLVSFTSVVRNNGSQR
jgi:hypothetical protein